MASSHYFQLVEAWRRLDVQTAPYILLGDEILRGKYRNKELIFPYRSFDDFIAVNEHGRQPRTVFHTGLLPVPYCGNLEKAKVFILLGNPGFGYHDYYGESEVPNFRDALIRNLKQLNGDDVYPILYLNPRFGWHGGSNYWMGKFNDILKRSECSFVDTLQLISQGVAILESIPYHSSNMGCPGPVLRQLNSVRLMRDYVHQDLLHRARKGEIAILCLRGDWGIEKEEENVVLYEANESRAAHISLSTRGGRKLVEFLGLQLRPE